MEPPRLAPAMRSRKAIVLDFVTAYIGAHHGVSPSLEEIGAGCGGIAKQQAKYHVDRLVAEGLLLRRPGARGLALPSDWQRALVLLRTLGGVVEGALALEQLPLTFSALPMLPGAAQIAGGDGEGGDDGAGAGRGGPEGPAGD